MPVDVRQPVFEGSQPVQALWFDAALLGEAEARRRVLAAWEHGARAWRIHDGYLLEWARPRRLLCATAPGLPLCRQDGVLTSAPLSVPERARLAHGSAVLVLGATLHTCVPAPEQRIDPSLWLDLGALPLLAPARMPTGAAGFVARVPAPAPDVRALLGAAIPPPSPQRAAFFREAEQAGKAGAGAPGPGLSGWKRHALGVGIATCLVALFDLLGHKGDRAAGAGADSAAPIAAIVAGVVAVAVVLALRRLRGGGSVSGGARPGPVRARGTPARTGPSRKRPPSGDGWLARLALATHLSTLLGWRQANYLRRMLRQFDEGNLDEALRHAIPLDSLQPAGRTAFGTPGRRTHLDITGGAGSAAGIGLDARTQQILRAAYQRSFDMLDRAGRIDEAVFVLAELLNRNQEAVDYLERHGRLAQAAALAETLALPPAVSVRLHVMAGDVDRAVQLARLADAFGDAVAALERNRDERAAGLRLEWAEALAARGNVCEAASVVWPLAPERQRALAWLQSAERAGGELGVQGLLYRLALDPAAVRGSGDALHTLLDDRGEDAARLRGRACDCLLKLDAGNDVLRRIGAALWRRAVADAGSGVGALPPDRLKALLKFADDPVLAADVPAQGLPRQPDPTPLQARRDPLSIAFAERGVLALHDVRILPDGGYLLALGESGAALVRADGRETARFPVPAHHLVLADNGRRALVLGRRERVVRVARLDLVHRTARDWFSADLRFWASDYDGATWNVVAGERLMALDATAPDRSVLWQIGDLPGPIVGFDQQQNAQALLLAVTGGVEQWRYALPERRLLQRDRFAVDSETARVLPHCHGVEPFVIDVAPHSGGDHVVLTLPRGQRILLPTPGPVHATVHCSLLLVRFVGAGGWHCQLLDLGGRLLAEVMLPDAASPRATVQAGHLLAWDQAGRLVDIDIDTSRAATVTPG